MLVGASEKDSSLFLKNRLRSNKWHWSDFTPRKEKITFQVLCESRNLEHCKEKEKELIDSFFEEGEIR